MATCAASTSRWCYSGKSTAREPDGSGYSWFYDLYNDNTASRPPNHRVAKTLEGIVLSSCVYSSDPVLRLVEVGHLSADSLDRAYHLAKQSNLTMDPVGDQLRS